MTITISDPGLEARLLAKAQSHGVSADALVAELLHESEERESQVRDFDREIARRIQALDRGEFQDGEETMKRLIEELTTP